MAGRVVPLAASEQTVAASAAAFLAQPSLAPIPRAAPMAKPSPGWPASWAATGRCRRFTLEAVTVAVTTAWSGRAPATWNRQVATVGSFLTFCRRRRWLVADLAADLERRPEPVDRTMAIPLPRLERLWRCEDVAVREKALWRAAL
jgi:hypothetical protein